jgi:hypothetical protein
MTESNQGTQIVTIGKIPGQLHELAIEGRKKICELFGLIGIKDLGSCEIQKNGSAAGINEYVEAGDTVLAVAKIRGN